MIRNPFYGPYEAEDRITYPDFEDIFQKPNNNNEETSFIFSLKDLSIDIVPDVYINDDPNSSVHELHEQIDDSHETLAKQSPNRNKLSYQRFLCHDAIKCELFWDKLKANNNIHASPAIKKYEARVDHIIFTPQKTSPVPLPKPPPSLQKSQPTQSIINSENFDASNISSPVIINSSYCNHSHSHSHKNNNNNNSHNNHYSKIINNNNINGFPSPIIASPIPISTNLSPNLHHSNHINNLDFIESPPCSPKLQKSLLSPPKRVPRYERQQRLDESLSFNLSTSPNGSSSLVKQLIIDDDISCDASNTSRRLNFDAIDDDDDEDIRDDIDLKNSLSDSLSKKDCSLELSHSTTSRSPQLEFSVSEVRSELRPFSPDIL